MTAQGINIPKNGKFGIEQLIYFTLFLFIVIVYVTGLFPETSVDSAKYASVSREMLSNGDLIHLKIHGDPYMQKPPFVFWLGAAFFKLFGISIVVFKIPTLLFMLLGIYSTYRLGKLMYNKNTGLLAALLYSANEALFLLTNDVHTDMIMASNLIFGTWQLAEYLENRKVLNFILGFVGVGFAMISKGFLFVAVAGLSVAGYLLAKKRYRSLFSVKLLWGLLILAIIVYPALKGLYDQFGLEGLKFYFWSNNIDRLRGVYSHNKHDYFFSFHTLIYLYLPWSVYAYAAFVRDAKRWYKNRFRIDNPKLAFAYFGIFPLFLTICISSQQSPHYLLPVIPFISIVTAGYLSDLISDDKYYRQYKWMKISGYVISFLAWPVALVMMLYFFPTSNVFIWGYLVVLLIIQIYCMFKLKTKLQQLIIPPLISILIIGFVFNTVYMPSALKYHGPIQASYFYNKVAGEDEPLYTYEYGQYETYFYPEKVSKKVHDEKELKELFSGDSSFWLITTEKGYDIIKPYRNRIEEEYVFPYKKLTNLSLKFMNPKTREKTLKNIYLLKIGPEDKK